jgi:uncharacterized spore protein YtfJ
MGLGGGPVLGQAGAAARPGYGGGAGAGAPAGLAVTVAPADRSAEVVLAV